MKHKELIGKIGVFIGIIVVLILLAVLYAYLDDEYNMGFSCTLNQLFGIYCPGCGLTRAGIAMLQLDFYQAFRYNAFSLIIISGIFFASVCFIWETIFNKNNIISKIPIAFWVIFTISFLIYGVIRNFIPILKPIAL